VFWWFGAAIELFGKTILALRIAGFMWLVLAAYVLYRSALSITQSRFGGVFAGAMLIVASSAYSLYVSTENLAVLPMAGAILVLQDDGRQLRSIFLAGILLGIACMFRLNLIYLCFVVGIFLSIQAPRGTWEAFFYGALKRGVCFSVGILAPALLSFVPYLLSNHSQLWMEFYEAAVSFSGEPHSVANNVAETLRESWADLVGRSMWGAAIFGAFIICRRWRDFNSDRRFNWLLCGAFVLGTFLSIVMTHTKEVPIARHYFTQLVPGLSMFAGATFMRHSKGIELSKREGAKFVLGLGLIALMIFRTSAAEWRTLTQHLWAGASTSYGIEYEIADLIRSQQIEDYTLFMMDNHLVYWLLGRYPLTRLATHPSNVSKPSIRKYLEPLSVTTEDALRRIFLREPTFVVCRPNLWYLDSIAVRFLERELTTSYVLVGRVGLAQIFRRTAHKSRGA
jgi:hypothetical protein